MNPLAIAALVGGGALVYHEATKDDKAATKAADAKGAAALDVGMDPTIALAVSQAIAKETDAAVLTNLATLLQQAGYPNSATAVAAKAKK